MSNVILCRLTTYGGATARVPNDVSNYITTTVILGFR